MNIVGIDPSLASTALSVNGKMFNYTSFKNASTKKGNLSKWFDLCQPFITYRFLETETDKDYSKNEILKLMYYDEITNNIIDDIDANLDESFEGTIIGIEGYSYSSAVGPLIDLVTFSTLLRKKLVEKVNTNVTVYAPTSLKKLSAELTYEADDKGIFRNNDGLSGGKFTKTEMMISIIENLDFNDDWAKFLRDNKDDLLKFKNIPKPIDDINDAYLLSKVIS